MVSMGIFGKLFGETKARNQIGGLTAREWYDKGFSLYKAGKFEEALGCYEKVLKLSPDNTLALGQKGRNSFSLLARSSKAAANLGFSDDFTTPFGTKLIIIKGVFTVRFEFPNLEVVREEDGQIFLVELDNLSAKKQPDSPDLYIEEEGKKVGLYLCTGHRGIFWKIIENRKIL